MNYYHIIYNSSQYNQAGAPGFGVRTCTQNTPPEYIRAITKRGCFEYDSGSITQPSPEALLADGSVILDMPITYIFTTVYVPEYDRTIFVYLRTICVGFDYPYYINFAAARTNNFVTDCYVFDQYPGREFAQIFYEDPQDGCQSFIPKSPVPCPENEEMKALSLGHSAPLLVENKKFSAILRTNYDEQTVKLLFAYYEARRLNKSLLVRCPHQKASCLMADLLRILPPSLAEEATIVTNHQSEGEKRGYRIFFINEGYRYTPSPQQFFILDLNRDEKNISQEYQKYHKTVEQYLSNGDIELLDKFSLWLLAPFYSSIRDKKAEVINVMYHYVIEPSEFSINEVLNGNEELWGIMKTYFANEVDRQTLFDLKLTEYIEAPHIIYEEIDLLHKLEKLEACGLKFSSNVRDYREKTPQRIIEKLLLEPECDATSFIKHCKKDFNLNNLTIIQTILTIVSRSHKTTVSAWKAVEKCLSELQKTENCQSITTDTARKIADNLLYPIQGKIDTGKWEGILILLSEGNSKLGNINSENAEQLIKIAIKSNNRKMLRYATEQGIRYYDERSLLQLLEIIRTSLPEVSINYLFSQLKLTPHTKAFFEGLVNNYELKLRDISRLYDANPGAIDKLELNQLCLSIYKKPLHSDSSLLNKILGVFFKTK